MFENMNDSVELRGNIDISWSRNGVGFGQLYFYEQDGQVFCSNEMMGKEFIKKV